MGAKLSRRDFLQLAGAVGGSNAVFRAAMGLGLLAPVARASKPELAKPAKPRKVLILGAGISGLTAAYELNKAGYEVQVLEASFRAGGRNMTVRNGDRIDETGYQQVCNFDKDPDLYFNCGPARIPGHHQNLLNYCKELDVELEPFINDNRNAWVQDDAMFGGKPIRAREYMSDSRGFVAELMSKSMKPEQFAAPLTAEDYERLREYMKYLGTLDPSFKYAGTSNAGLAKHDYTNPDVLKTPLDGRELLKSKFMAIMNFGETDDQAAMMMEPVGGMDRVPAGFMRKIGHLVQLESQVQKIQVLPKGVEVTYRRNGEYTKVKADYVINCIPMHLLAGIEHNFAKEHAAGFLAVPRGKLFKIGLQMKQRFWEDEGIYGGISWTTQDIQQIWYPAHGIHRKKGVVLAAYTFDPNAGEKFARLAPADRIKLAIEQGSKIHPKYGDYVETGVTVAWHQMNHMLGCAAQWDEELWKKWFTKLQAPQGAHYLVGDQVSYHPGWQEGAMASAHHAIADIDARERAAGKAVHA
ncbi:MAG TPA: flavin monoamine oxidase family protein [Steroidobacteraceae bacterium]|nr:flavin monoamine oxidase family protein [Steroidobacteraceae bacterium]